MEMKTEKASRIRVVVAGAAGRMGRQVLAAVSREPDMELVGGVDVREGRVPIDAERTDGFLEVTRDLVSSLTRLRPDVMVDFTHPAAVMENVRTALGMGVRCVVGTTGLGAQDIDEIDRLCHRNGIGAVVAPNFAIGAVLMMKFAEMASRYFHAAEIIELHHDRKIDAPSGTAIKTAQGMARVDRARAEAAAGGEEPLARGESVGGVRIHSVRLPGLVAHQEVLFGGPGQVLTIRHDSISRESFMPGVMLAIRRVMDLDHAVFGLEHLLDL
ncbi:MAG: 4-hydroxy-tetrahydrodipicolinate reductase [Bacillota bacterium]|nr:4-hydroxy-tetrahydrodipicolinate reductase [Bacillota bacterium]